MDFKRYSKYILPALIYAIVLTACDPHLRGDIKYVSIYNIKNCTDDTLKIWRNRSTIISEGCFYLAPDSVKCIEQYADNINYTPTFDGFDGGNVIKDSIVIFSLKGEKLCEWDEDGRNLPGKQFYKESSWKKRVWEKEEKSYYEWTFEINTGDISKGGE